MPILQPRTVVTSTSELHKALHIDTRNGSCDLRSTDGGLTLPGQARVRLDTSQLLPYLRKEHLVPELDKLSAYIRSVSFQLFFSVLF